MWYTCAFICSTISNLNALNVLLENFSSLDHVTQTRGWQVWRTPGARQDGRKAEVTTKWGPQPGSSDQERGCGWLVWKKRALCEPSPRVIWPRGYNSYRSNSLSGRCYHCPHFTDGQTKAQRDYWGEAESGNGSYKDARAHGSWLVDHEIALWREESRGRDWGPLYTLLPTTASVRRGAHSEKPWGERKALLR